MHTRTFFIGLFFAAAALSSAHGTSVWFAVMGQVGDLDVDTVEVNLEDLPPRGKIEVMFLRVTLAKQRTNPAGDKYASYLSRVSIDCEKSAIVHIDQTRYVEKRWRGAGTFQSFPEVRPMAFGGLVPNPRETILRAACANLTPVR